MSAESDHVPAAGAAEPAATAGDDASPATSVRDPPNRPGDRATKRHPWPCNVSISRREKKSGGVQHQVVVNALPFIGGELPARAAVLRDTKSRLTVTVQDITFENVTRCMIIADFVKQYGFIRCDYPVTTRLNYAEESWDNALAAQVGRDPKEPTLYDLLMHPKTPPMTLTHCPNSVHDRARGPRATLVMKQSALDGLNRLLREAGAPAAPENTPVADDDEAGDEEDAPASAPASAPKAKKKSSAPAGAAAAAAAAGGVAPAPSTAVASVEGARKRKRVVSPVVSPVRLLLDAVTALMLSRKISEEHLPLYQSLNGILTERDCDLLREDKFDHVLVVPHVKELVDRLTKNRCFLEADDCPAKRMRAVDAAAVGADATAAAAAAAVAAGVISQTSS